MSKLGDIWYRADERWIDTGSEVYEGVTIAVVVWVVTKTTPQGVWLRCPTSLHLKPRWASVSSRVFAITRAEAIDKLIGRRTRQLRILQNQLLVATDVLDAAKALRRTLS